MLTCAASELLDAGQVCLRVGGFSRTVIQLTQSRAGDEDFRVRETAGNRLLSGEERDDDVGVEEEPTRH